MFNRMVKPDGMTTGQQDENDPQRAAILDAAATVFAAHGFAGARVEAIAKAAGMNKAMLYYRVGDKARLYELVILGQFDRVAEAVERARSEGEWAESAGAILAALAGLFARDPRLPRIMAWEFVSGGATIPEAVTLRWARIMSVVFPLAARAGMDPVLLYMSMLGPMVRTCLTAPRRERSGAGKPGPLGRVAAIGVDDMAAFLTGLFRKAVGETKC